MLYNQGREFMEAGELEQAIQSFQASVQALPHFKTLELLGECLLTLRKPWDAIVPLAAATALNSQVRAPALLAQAFLQGGEFHEAGKFASLVLTRAPGNKLAREVMDVPAVKSALARSRGDEAAPES